ncbi:GNAT family N-acetyltransferase [Kitasatospora kifunensis]|uniref:RimJ/RimL family protein N-acetyltransferase n=1 Tax=Kitasatospora kifunensis TaxID=58351 RepID=A0A7W7R7S6_KITKI|nr:GNAT family N-acetyltransferase [Kitasatospora kifunensis]MBB4926708.1 RimJ/RimL family protein N-acetyltransferase [Kitasatospora kifunensis]
MLLRDVEPGDLDAYVRMRCDPEMMAELGGPLPREAMADKVRRDVERALADRQWIKMIVPDGAAPTVVAGTVTLWAHEAHEAHEAGAGAGSGAAARSEIGWMVLPEFQRRGLGKRAVAELLGRARADGRWGVVSAFPATTNAASNGICRSLGFQLVGEVRTVFAGRALLTNHWTIET